MFSQKLFKVAVTLKYGHGHWKLYEKWVVPSFKFDTFHINGVWENCNAKSFQQTKTVDWPKTC